MPNTSQIAPTVVSCYGGLILNKDIFSMKPGDDGDYFTLLTI